MYADLLRRRVPIGRLESLPRQEVLFIILSAPDPERPRKDGCRRVRETWGLDWYYVSVQDGTVELGGWDDEWRFVHDVDDPFGMAVRKLAIPQLPDSSVVFEGSQVSADKWAEAMGIFEKEMH